MNKRVRMRGARKTRGEYGEQRITAEGQKPRQEGENMSRCESQLRKSA